MIIILGYLLFCLTTAIMATFEILVPVLRKLKKEHQEHNLLKYTPITYATFLSLAVVVAPMIFLPIIVPSMGDRFRAAMFKSFVED